MEKIRISDPKEQSFEQEHASQVRALAPECMVLLKNDGVLPLGKKGKLALYGSGARRTIKGGTGSGDVNVRHFTNVEEGLEEAGFEITTKAWLDAYDRAVDQVKGEFFGALRKAADALGMNPVLAAMGKVAPEPEYHFPLLGEGDTAVYVLARISGEGADRLPQAGDVELTETEVRDILAISRQYKHFVLVLNVGGMVDLEPVKEVPAILLMGQLGTPTGSALADVLTGKAFPSGKLTMTWAPVEAYPSAQDFGDPNDTDYREGIYVGYRYFNTFGVQTVYPFGYGLGYTTFCIEPEAVACENGKAVVTATVANTGSRLGKEVVQVYVSSPPGALDKPYQALAGYRKTRELAPGEKETVTIAFPMADLASYDQKRAAWVLEAGGYVVRVGNSSQNTQVAGKLLLQEEVVTEKVRNVGGGPGFEDKLPPNGQASAEKGERALAIDPAAVDRREIVYGGEPRELPAAAPCAWEQVKAGEKTVEDFVAGLTEEQLAWLCIGAYTDAEDIMEVIGNAASTVAGAAGETTGRLEDLGLPVLVMADGPAGLRLSPDYVLSGGKAKGRPSLGGDMLLVYSPEERAAMAGEPAPGETYYQYCTAIPIGTGIAQSWNDALAEQCGRLVGEEMEQFGVHIWLAPALNIMRSPLCGRNFEYYSEDPLLSGRMAAGITRGVQGRPGRAVTIKHYACNNQETNRYFSNSNVSERAMREIYLKGFEICVKEARPRFLMTSYNLINGEHACNRRDLLTDILRDEWGFEGVVMTDWLVTGGMGPQGEKWPCASAAGNVRSGNDITMPGMPSDKRDILAALAESGHPYALTKAYLQQCAIRVLEQIRLLF